MDTPLTAPDRLAAGLAIALHVGIAVFPLAASGLVAPPWFLALTALVWVAGAAAVVHLVRRTPRRAWMAPVAVVALWMAAITLGEQLLGWTA